MTAQSNDEPDEYLYRTVVRFNAIYVLESLGPGELKTGQDLFDSVIYPAKARLGEMHAEFVSLPTQYELLRQLGVIAHAARVGNHHPIVHIEAHGGPDGIELADGSWMAWRQLIPALTDINVACKNNLISSRDFLLRMESHGVVDAFRPGTSLHGCRASRANGRGRPP